MIIRPTFSSQRVYEQKCVQANLRSRKFFTCKRNRSSNSGNTTHVAFLDLLIGTFVFFFFFFFTILSFFFIHFIYFMMCSSISVFWNKFSTIDWPCSPFIDVVVRLLMILSFAFYRVWYHIIYCHPHNRNFETNKPKKTYRTWKQISKSPIRKLRKTNLTW